MTSMLRARHVSWPRWIVLASLWLLLAIAPGAAQERRDRDRVTGEWQQFLHSGGAWRATGVYRVSRRDGEYRMTPVTQTDDPDIVTSKGLSDVEFSESEWTFKSDWGKQGVGEFRLRRIGPGAYLGWSYLKDERQNLNLWLLLR